MKSTGQETSVKAGGNLATCFHVYFFDHEDLGDMFLRNVS
jgi:hypothetical protein